MIIMMGMIYDNDSYSKMNYKEVIYSFKSTQLGTNASR